MSYIVESLFKNGNASNIRFPPTIRSLFYSFNEETSHHFRHLFLFCPFLLFRTTCPTV